MIAEIDKKQRHILVAEDEPNLLLSLKFILAASGYRVTLTTNGRAAYNVVENSLLDHSGVDLLITDIAMPEMDGEELVSLLHKKSIDVPVLVITGYGDRDLVIRLMRLGCRDFLDKPFQPADLEERVEMLLAQTHQERLEKQRKEHLALVGEKSCSAIHDLNNALGGTIGYADLALEAIGASHPVRKKLEKVLASANLAAEICRKLLSLKSENVVSIKIKTEVRSIVERIATVMHSIAPESVEIRTAAPDFPVWLEADAERLQQALLNLGINSLDAMPKGGFLSFAVSRMEACRNKKNPSRPCVCISVADTGKGIPGPYLSKLFLECFTTKVNGHGYGLSIVKTIVQEHDGWIEVESVQGKGATFKLYFPKQ